MTYKYVLADSDDSAGRSYAIPWFLPEVLEEPIGIRLARASTGLRGLRKEGLRDRKYESVGLSFLRKRSSFDPLHVPVATRSDAGMITWTGMLAGEIGISEPACDGSPYTDSHYSRHYCFTSCRFDWFHID